MMWGGVDARALALSSPISMELGSTSPSHVLQSGQVMGDCLGQFAGAAGVTEEVVVVVSMVLTVLRTQALQSCSA